MHSIDQTNIPTHHRTYAHDRLMYRARRPLGGALGMLSSASRDIAEFTMTAGIPPFIGHPPHPVQRHSRPSPGIHPCVPPPSGGGGGAGGGGGPQPCCGGGCGGGHCAGGG